MAYAPAAPAVPRPPSAMFARGAAPVPRQPVYRAAPPEERPPLPTPPAPAARPAPLTIPSPEQLGVARASLPANPTPASPGIDWNAVQRRLAELGVVSSRVDRLPAGACRFVCWLADRARPDLTHCVEARAASADDAVRLGLQRAAQWRGQHPLR